MFSSRRGAVARVDGGFWRDAGQWRSLAAAHDLTIAGGFCELGPDGKLYNSAAIVDAAGTRAVYRKVHLWDGEEDLHAWR